MLRFWQGQIFSTALPEIRNNMGTSIEVIKREHLLAFKITSANELPVHYGKQFGSNISITSDATEFIHIIDTITNGSDLIPIAKLLEEQTFVFPHLPL